MTPVGRSGRWVVSGYRGSVADSTAPVDRPGAPIAAVPEVGGYRLLTKIGEGGMGVVHLAQAPGGPRVALKVLRPHVVGDDEARARLAREVASLRLIHSPRVAEIVDADPWGALPFVATRYVPGLSLHEHLRTEGPILGDDLVWFARGLAAALSDVHAAGVLHRDIKPSNVLLEGRTPVLIDFGLARLAEDSRITHTGWLLGTPGYLAPEILYGDEPTPAADVHAWAATVAFASTGAPPYGRGPAMAVLDRVRRGEHDLSAVDPVLRPLLAESLAPDPLERPSLGEIAERLADWLAAHEPRAATEEPIGREPTTMTMPLAWDLRRPSDDPAPGEDPEPAFDSDPLTVPYTEYAGDADGAEGADGADAGEPLEAAPDRAPLRRGLLAATAGTAAVLGLVAAPYVAATVLLLLVWMLRTASWTASATRERRLVRGAARWYDVPLSVLAAPWYAAVASWGALVLACWTAVLVFLGVVMLLLLGAAEAVLVPLTAVVLVAGLWWGPGSGRVRRPAITLVRGWSRRPGLAWLGVVALLVLAGAAAWSAGVDGPLWSPAGDAPWADGTLLGHLRR